MRHIMPSIKIEGDKNSIMSRSGDVVGFNKTHVLWRFGFLPLSDSAKAHKVCIPKFIWVIATPKGKVIDRLDGKFGIELPKQYRKIID